MNIKCLFSEIQYLSFKFLVYSFPLGIYLFIYKRYERQQ